MKVLLVEDRESVLNEIITLFSASEGLFSLVHVPDAEACIKQLNEGGIEAILFDLGLQNNRGLEALSAIQEAAPGIPIVVIADSEADSMSFEALKRGARDCLEKSQLDSKLVTRVIRYAIERENIEEAVKISEEKHFALLEAMPDIVYKIDTEGYFKYLNNAVEILGYLPEELIGEHFSSIVHPDDLDNISRSSVLKKYEGVITGYINAPKLLDERRTGKRMTRDLVFRLIPKGWIADSNVEPLFGSLTSYGDIVPETKFVKKGIKKATFQGSVGIIKDITARKRTEEEKAALESQLQHSQKMEAIGRLAGGVAHDMNNVLSAIWGSASVLELEIDKDDPKKADIDNILIACRKGRDLTRDLLGFARKGKYVKESLSLNDIVLEVQALLSRTITKKVSIETALEAKPDFIEGDKSQIHHVLMNVCINAVDSMRGQSRLAITTKNAQIDEISAKAGELEPGKYIELKVIDTGVGMSAEVKDKAFEPFFTTKPKGEGTGLGLSMVYGVVKNHGGTVSIESELNVGTTVSFLLPACEEGARRKSNTPSIRPSSKPNRGGILLVDDESIIRASAKRLIEKIGYRVFLADNGLTAIEEYERHREEISLVLLDLLMPEMDGSEAFEVLVEMDPEIRVLLLSGYSKDEKVESLLSKGALGFVQKPFDYKTLSEAIKAALT